MCGNSRVSFTQSEQSFIQNMVSVVSFFGGEYSFLSNSYLMEIKYKKHVYQSVEHLYQATKCSNKKDREKIRNATTPKSAKILGRFVKIRSFWSVNKIDVMKTILQWKFCNSKLRKLLKQTGNKELLNQNYYHDTFWGVCGCTKHHRAGINMLGQILMQIRTEINKTGNKK